MSEETIKTGKIKALKDRGYGFIAGNDGQDVYFHATNVVTPEFKLLRKWDIVNYVIRENERGPEAVEVVVISN